MSASDALFAYMTIGAILAGLRTRGVSALVKKHGRGWAPFIVVANMIILVIAWGIFVPFVIITMLLPRRKT